MERDGFDISADREPLPADYIHDLDDADGLTEAQQLELLGILFDMMKSFVLMGYGMEPVNRLLETFEFSARGNDPVIECEHDKKNDGPGVDNA
ncbi:MAG: hypothetical protein AAGL10_06265 [Pseudomonadota bacterium]